MKKVKLSPLPERVGEVELETIRVLLTLRTVADSLTVSALWSHTRLAQGGFEAVLREMERHGLVTIGPGVWSGKRVALTARSALTIDHVLEALRSGEGRIVVHGVTLMRIGNDHVEVACDGGGPMVNRSYDLRETDAILVSSEMWAPPEGTSAFTPLLNHQFADVLRAVIALLGDEARRAL